MRTEGLAVVLVVTMAAPGLGVERPVPITPGSPDGVMEASSECPTFQWATTSETAAVDLVVVRLSDLESKAPHLLPEPALALDLPGGATGWTPSTGACLEAGRDYAWAVRALVEGEWTEWSVSSLFRTAAALRSEDLATVSRVWQDHTRAELTSPSDLDAAPTQSRHASGHTRVRESVRTSLRAEQIDTSGETYGVLGISKSNETGSAGLVGESTFDNSGSGGRTGWVSGVIGIVASPEGAAGLFENTAGGAILRGISAGSEVFLLSGGGDLTASGEVSGSAFMGDGSGLSNVDAETFDGRPADQFGDIQSVATGAGLTGGWTSSAVEISVGADALTASKLASAAAGVDQIAPGAVRSEHFVYRNLTGGDLADGAVTTAQIANGAIVGGPGGDLGDGGLVQQDFDTSQVQSRISGACGADRSIDFVTSQGTVGCEYDDFQRPTLSQTYYASSKDGVPDYKIVSAVGQVCYLTYVNLADIDGKEENASCSVILDQTTEPDTWVLRALTTSGDDAESSCGMRCLRIQERAD